MTLTIGECIDLLKSSEITGLNFVLDILTDCVVYSDLDKKNYIDHTKLVDAINARKKIINSNR